MPFPRRTYSQAFLYPSSQRFHMAARKGKGERPVNFKKYGVVWFLHFHWRKMLCIIHLFFRFPQPLVIDNTSIQFLLLCKLLTALTGRQTAHRGRFRIAAFPLYSTQLHYNLKISSCSSDSGQHPPFLGILMLLAPAQVDRRAKPAEAKQNWGRKRGEVIRSREYSLWLTNTEMVFMCDLQNVFGGNSKRKVSKLS